MSYEFDFKLILENYIISNIETKTSVNLNSK